MAITKINQNQVRFQDPNGILFIPWSNGIIGSDGYDVHDIVGDTFSLTQDDPDRNEIPWEFGDDPLDENVSLGNKNLTMQCLDFQNSVMTHLFGWETDASGNFVAAPAQYKDLICTIVLTFEGKSIVMPKVKMDSKAVFENLRSDIARGELGGVLYSTEVQFGSDTNKKETSLFFMKNGKAFTINSITVTINADGSATISEGATILDTMDFDAASATQDTFTVTGTTGTVTAVEDTDWVVANVNTTSGTVVEIDVADNLGTTARSAKVYVYDDTTLKGVIIVNQAAPANS